jgi:hypothetical protein
VSVDQALQFGRAQGGRAPAAQQMRLAARRHGRLQVARGVADHRHRAQIDAVARADLLDQAGLGLAAVAAFLRRVRTEEHRVEPSADAGQPMHHVAVDRVDRRHVDHAAPDAGLIGRDHGVPAGVVQARHGLQCPGHRFPFVGRLDVVVAVHVQDAVAAQDHELDDVLHGRSAVVAARW